MRANDGFSDSAPHSGYVGPPSYGSTPPPSGGYASTPGSYRGSAFSARADGDRVLPSDRLDREPLSPTSSPERLSSFSHRRVPSGGSNRPLGMDRDPPTPTSFSHQRVHSGSSRQGGLGDPPYPGHFRSPPQSHLGPRDDMPPPSFPGMRMGADSGDSREPAFRSPPSSHMEPRSDMPTPGHSFSHWRMGSGSSRQEGGPSPQVSPTPGYLRPRDDIPTLPRPEGMRSPTSSHLEPISDFTPGRFSHQRVPSGGAAGPPGGRMFSHRRTTSGSSTASGRHKTIVTPRHDSSRALVGYYDVVSDLGKGSFGVVKMVKDRTTAQERVCKHVSIAQLSAGVLDMVRKEVELLCALDHPHVVKLFEYVEDFDKQELVLILEYVPGGSCADYLKKSMFNLAEDLVVRLIYQVSSAIAYCHASGVAHRDVKPEHMMLTQAGLWGQPNCKLIDFGLASFSETANRDDFVGTPEYMAPEVVHRRTEDPNKLDIWSIGISTIELLTGRNPFGKPIELGSNDPVYAAIKRYSDFGSSIEDILYSFRGWEKRSGHAHSFVFLCLSKDPGARATARQLIDHPWLEDFREKRSNLTRDMIRSMSSYISSHLLVQCCLYLIAARTAVPNRERLEAAFVWLDRDNDGEISSADLAGALSKGTEWSEWWDTADLMSVLRGSPSFDPVALVNAADLDMSGGLSFTEFVATCLYAQDSTDINLVKRAFEVLDDDRDGLVHASEIFELFEELELSANGPLPQDKQINLEEWCQLFNEAFTQPTYKQRKVVVRKQKRGWC